jgi:hypothetical protein
MDRYSLAGSVEHLRSPSHGVHWGQFADPPKKHAPDGLRAGDWQVREGMVEGGRDCEDSKHPLG